MPQHHPIIVAEGAELNPQDIDFIGLFGRLSAPLVRGRPPLQPQEPMLVSHWSEYAFEQETFGGFNSRCLR